MSKISQTPTEFREQMVINLYRMVEKFDKETSNDSDAMKKVLGVLKKKVMSDLYRAFLGIDPQRRIDLKRILKSVDGDLESSSDVIEVKGNLDKDKTKKGLVSKLMKKLSDGQELTRKDYKFLQEEIGFENFTEPDYLNKKVWLKYMDGSK